MTVGYKRPRRVNAAVFAGLTTLASAAVLLSSAPRAEAFIDYYECYRNAGQFCGQGNYHSITYNRVSTPARHTTLCSSMITAAGNQRGGRNFCGDNVTSVSQCHTSATPASQGYGIFYQQGGSGFDRINGVVDNSPNHTGCV